MVKKTDEFLIGSNIGSMIVKYAEDCLRDADNFPEEIRKHCIYAAQKDREIGESVVNNLRKIKDQELRDKIQDTLNLALSTGIWAYPKINGNREIRDLARLAGIASGARRAKKAAETWERHALTLANASRKVNKAWSQDSVTDYVLANWGQKKDKPGHARLKQRISHWIKEGRLPEKVR